MTRDEAIKENIARRILANQARLDRSLNHDPHAVQIASPKRKRRKIKRSW